MKKAYIVVALAVALTGCGGGGGSADGIPPASVTPDVGTQDPVGRIAFSPNPVRAESRMLSYGTGAARLSLIDPDVPREVWGVMAPGYEFAVPFAAGDGATLVGEDELRVVSGADQRAFALAQNYAHTASAASALAYALSAVDGGSLEVLRYLGSAGQWQHEILTVPWSNKVLERPPGQPVLLASLFNAEGTLLMAFRPADGAYTVFAAAGASSPLELTGRDCAGDGVGTVEQATFRSFVWDEDRGRVYAGDRHGNLYAIDPKGACAALPDVPTLTLDAAAITQLAIRGAGQLSVLQDNGQLHQVSFDGGAFSRVASLTTPCTYPDGAVELGDGLHLVTCLSESRPGIYGVKEYLTLEEGRDTVRARFVLAEVDAKNIVIDSARRVMFRVEDNALGVLVRYDLLSGNISSQRGLFLEGILAGE